MVERGNGTAGDDGEAGSEGGDGNEAEVGSSGEEFVGAERRLGVMEGVTLGETVGEWRVLEVPHEGSGVEEFDSGDTKAGALG